MRELAPSSDVDLLFLINGSSNKISYSENEIFIEKFFVFLWDLGFSVGHSTRTISDANYATKDLTFLTSLIDNRFLVGNYEFLKIYKFI